MKGFKSLTNLVAGEFTPETGDKWRELLHTFQTEVGKYLCENGSSFNKRVEGFKNNSKLIRDFIKYGDSESTLETFVLGLTETELDKLKELSSLKSTHIDVYNQIENRYKTDEEIVDDLYKLCGSLSMSQLSNVVLDSHTKTKVTKDGCYSTSFAQNFDLKELELTVNGRKVFISDDDKNGDVYLEESTKREEIKDIIFELLKES